MPTEKKPKKVDPTPYLAIDVMSGEGLSRHAAQYEGYDAHKGEPVEVYYRPRKRGF